MPQSSHSTLPLIPLPYPLILLPGARATFPISHKQADALVRLLDSSLSNPVLAAVPLVQQEGRTTLNRWGVTAHIARFVRPRPHSDEPYLLTLTGTARIRLANDHPPLPASVTQMSSTESSNNGATTDAGNAGNALDALLLSRVDVVRPPPDAQSPPTPDVVQDFKAAAIRLLERFAQDASQSARKRESWSRIAHLVDETEPSRAAALADAIVSAISADNTDKLGESPSFCDVHPSVLLFATPALDPRVPPKSSFGHIRNSSWPIRSSTPSIFP